MYYSGKVSESTYKQLSMTRQAPKLHSWQHFLYPPIIWNAIYPWIMVRDCSKVLHIDTGSIEEYVCMVNMAKIRTILKSPQDHNSRSNCNISRSNCQIALKFDTEVKYEKPDAGIYQWLDKHQRVFMMTLSVSPNSSKCNISMSNCHFSCELGI